MSFRLHLTGTVGGLIGVLALASCVAGALAGCTTGATPDCDGGDSGCGPGFPPSDGTTEAEGAAADAAEGGGAAADATDAGNTTPG